MANEPKDILLEVAYEERELAEVELTAQEVLELESLREFREELGEGFEVFEPSDEVRARILTLAAQEVARRGSHGFWGRLAGQRAQLAMVAVMLIVAAVVVRIQTQKLSIEPRMEESAVAVGARVETDLFDGKGESEVETTELKVMADALAPDLEDMAERAVADEVALEMPAPAPAPRAMRSRNRAPEQTPRNSGRVAPREAVVKREAPRRAPREELEFAKIADSASNKEIRAASPMAKVQGMGDEVWAEAEMAVEPGLPELESAFVEREYREVIRLSYRVPGPRAMELRADAFRLLGESEQARKEYDALAARHPDYKRAQIRARLSELPVNPPEGWQNRPREVLPAAQE